MRIKKFRIKEYKSILDSGEVTLDSKITTLIGKNEAGKTCILKALESFKSDYEYVKDDLCLHSEVKKKLDSDAIEKEDIEIVTIWFEIESQDKRTLKEISPQLTKIKTLQVTKCFDNSYRSESPDICLEELNISSKKEIQKNLSIISSITASFKEKLDSHCERFTPFSNSKNQYEEIINEVISFDPQTDLDVAMAFDDFQSRLISLPNLDGPIQDDIQVFSAEMKPYKDRIEEILLEEEESVSVVDYILEILPDFMYFANIEELEDTVPVSTFLANKEKHKTLSNLIELSGLDDLERVRDAEVYDMSSQLRTASADVTGLVNKAWTQEKVEVNIDIMKNEIVISIFDDVTKKEHPPSIRSQGFQWFLRFYINFAAGSKHELQDTIILLDDPGVYLHPSGQKDLLKTLEEISESNQIIFSTHSPFMIDLEKLERIRIVSKEEKKGTLIEEKFYESDYDALQPIRASIGMTIGDSLFTTKKNILVEGYSDKLILEAMSKICSEKNENYIDPSEVSVLPVNGADKILYLAIFLVKENLKLVILLDHDSKGRKAAEKLKDNINEDNILTLDPLAETGCDLVIEDLIDIDFYLEAVNLAYRNIFEKRLGKESISKEDLQEVSFSGVKEFFKEKAIGTSKRVAKISIAKKIYDLVVEGKLPQDQTISKFSQIF